jgi:hypothetical protein
MVQGHLTDTLLTPAARAASWYAFQQQFHGSTAPGFLFASGFVAGLPRAPLSVRATLRRARRLLFVLGVGYALQLPYFSFWKTVQASPAELAVLFAVNALQVIAVSQLFVLALQWVAGRRWPAAAAVAGALIVAATPFVWSSGLPDRVPDGLAAYLDRRTGSTFPAFPFAAFVLAGTLAGAVLGHGDAERRRRGLVLAGLALLGAGYLLHLALGGRVEFWGPSPAYVLLRLGGLLLLLRLVHAAADRAWPGVRALALLGHETLLVYVLHLFLLFGWLVSAAPLGPWHGRLGYGAAALALAALAPVLLLAAFVWRKVKVRWPREATLVLAFLTTAFLWEWFLRPW